jgi:cysteine desulfurase / selenocysteine lyase
MELDQFREMFPITKTHIFLNHASESPKSTRQIDMVNEFLQDALYGDLYEDKWLEHMQAVRRMAAVLVHASPDEIAFVNNVSTGAMLVANGLQWHSGENIVTNYNQFPANVYPWLNLRDRGVEVRTPFLPRTESAYETLFSAIDEHTRLIALSFVEYDNGFRYDLERIGQFCLEHNILFFVDAVQGLGVFPVDVQTANISFLATSGHKWLLGPSGQGFLYINKHILPRLYVLPISWLSMAHPFDFYNYSQARKSTAQTFEGGTSNLMGIVALGSGLSLIEQAGLQNITIKVRHLCEQLIDALPRKGYVVDVASDPAHRSAIVSFRHPEIPSERVQALLQQNKIIVSLRNGQVRISPHFYNSEQDINTFLKILH